MVGLKEYSLKEKRKSSKKNVKTEKLKTKKALNLEEELNKILDTSAAKVAKSKRLQEGTGVSMSYGSKIQDGIINTIRNPYNQVTVLNMFFLVVFTSLVGLLSGVLLSNAAVAICGMILGVITPFSLVNLKGLKNKMSMMKGNLMILMNHYPNYIDSATFEESLERTIANIEQGTPQCKAFRICLKNMRDNNMTITSAIDILRKQLMADKYVNYYLDGVVRAELEDKQYKQVLNSILVQFEYLVGKNAQLTGFAFMIYVMYVIGLVGMIFVVGILKSSDPVVYEFLTTTLAGQSATVVLFTAVGIVGFVISNTADLITLDGGFDKNKKDDEH